ncbi:putative oxidoreductase [Poriferisphaera corsica]|uniref:Putative oxidoreductase n=1 Tax=Poriferisphaera corsica TaxID=2528020 RepID=A0A517YZ27_9BACT|nr:SDR family oxidoreductase [Poriferisphaera corsica]QDU35478.1 putative oxidoreductase [Poriferisphaera corsica]
MQFTNKTILITGSNRGLGRALLNQLLKRNVNKIYACARNLNTLDNITHPKVHKLQLDITNPDHIQAAAQTAPDTNILINNAGIAAYENPLTTNNLDLIHRDFNTNLFSTLNMMRAFTPILQQNTPAAIINIVSIAAFVNFPFLGGYAASKAALFSLTQGIRIQLANTDIAVHTVNPGPIDTDMTQNIDMQKTSPTDAANAILSALIADQPDIFPDPTSQHMFNQWQQNYLDLEQAVLDMTTSPANHQ